jgi:hypothetical protein
VSERSETSVGVGPVVMPCCCDECEHFSGDGYNDCCQHPSFVDDGLNMNARPGRCRMSGCPLEV